MTRRRLRPEELALWHEVAKTARPLDPERNRTPPNHRIPEITPHDPPPRAQTMDESAQIASFRMGQTAQNRASHDLAPSLSDKVAGDPLRMDRKTHQRMRRGRLDPEARIDLHGMRADQAQAALQSFLTASHSAGRRLVLVITGKGRRGDDEGPIPRRAGVLRHQLPHWLSTPPLSAIVLQLREAHVRHGGSGAFYVYLKRRR